MVFPDQTHLLIVVIFEGGGSPTPTSESAHVVVFPGHIHSFSHHAGTN